MTRANKERERLLFYSSERRESSPGEGSLSETGKLVELRARREDYMTRLRIVDLVDCMPATSPEYELRALIKHS